MAQRYCAGRIPPSRAISDLTGHLLNRSMRYSGLHSTNWVLTSVDKQQLGIDQLEAIVSVGPLLRLIGRALFFWNHPVHTTKVAFKLGATALAISVFELIRDLASLS